MRDKKRLLAVFVPSLVVAVIFLYAYLVKPYESTELYCAINRRANIKCPTCGLTRALYSILFGDFKRAFYYHALFTVGFIPLTVVATGMTINFYFQKKVLPLPKFRWIYFYLLLAVVMVFTVLRNFTVVIY